MYSLSGWKSYAPSDRSDVYGPKLFKGLLHVDPETDLMEMPTKEKTADAISEMVPRDTYFDFSCGILEHCPWLHGSVFVNNFNVGRYHKAGPQQTLYIPGPLLHEGDNEVSFFHISIGNFLFLSVYPLAWSTNLNVIYLNLLDFDNGELAWQRQG